MATKRTLSLLLAAPILLVGACHDDHDSGQGAGGAVTTAAPSTSTSSAPSTSTSTTAPAAPDTSAAVFPSGEGATGFSDPVEAARAFAVGFGGFSDPVVGSFREGDARSGEVEVRARADGPPSTVLVRRLTGDGTWWVVGSTYAGLELDRPDPLDTVTSPLALAGRARAYEGTVLVEVREDGRADPIGSGFVTGSGAGDLGPFEGEVEFSAPSAAAGVLVLFTRGAEDNRVWELAAVRVGFAA